MTQPDSLADKIVHLHDLLDDRTLPHAFGGALALAWCTRQARATHDIDLNIFVGLDMVDQVLAALPASVEVAVPDRHLLSRDGQTRLWWGRHPLDLFLNTTDFHHDLGRRVRVQEFNGASVPFLACEDLAVFKAFFNRGKDWVDLEEMLRAGTADVPYVLGTLVQHLGVTDERVERLRSLAAKVEDE